MSHHLLKNWCPQKLLCPGGLQKARWEGEYEAEGKRNGEGSLESEDTLHGAVLPSVDWQPCRDWANLTPNTWLGREETKHHLLHHSCGRSISKPVLSLRFRHHSRCSLLTVRLHSAQSSSRFLQKCAGCLSVFTKGKWKGWRNSGGEKDIWRLRKT